MKISRSSKFKLIAYLLDHKVPVDQILASTSANITSQGFVFGDTTVELNDELMDLIKNYFNNNRNSIGFYLFPALDNTKIQSYDNFLVSFRKYLKESNEGKTLADFGLSKVFHKAVPKMETIEDILGFLKEKSVVPKVEPEIPKEEPKVEIVSKHKHTSRPA